MKKNIFQFSKTVFSTNELGIIWQLRSRQALRNKIYYWMENNKLIQLKRGVYALSENYDLFEAAGKILSPSYVSLSTILQETGVIFQYDSTLTSVAQLTREFQLDDHKYTYRKIKPDVFFNERGLIRKNNYTQATPERALLDLMYLVPDYHVDNLAVLDLAELVSLVEIYDHRRLENDLQKLIEN